jgi:hypothetical protein
MKKGEALEIEKIVRNSRHGVGHPGLNFEYDLFLDGVSWLLLRDINNMKDPTDLLR